MLQNIRDRISGWFAAVFLGAIAVVFIFWGIRFESTIDKPAAKINGEKVSREVVRRAWQERQSELQAQMRDELPPALVKEEQAKLLDSFIEREMLLQHARKLGYRVSDTELANSIAAIPQLQVDGKFSRDRYAALLRQQGRSEAQFEADYRSDLELQQLTNALLVSSFVTPKELQRRVSIEGETRDVEFVTFKAESFVNTATVSQADVSAWYEKHKQDYRTPETANLQYLELTLADVAAGVQVTEANLQAYYDQVAGERFSEPERRRASHVLIDASGDDAAARQKAEALLARIKAGEDFAAVARANSDDPGSKAAGGDLGWGTREAYVQPFADALFAMQKGEIRGPIKTQFGYHILRLDEVEPGKQKPLADVRAELEADYRRDQAQNAFYEKSQQLADESFAALSELDSVAKSLGLQVKTVEGYTRAGGGPFGTEKAVIDAVFSPESLEQRQNSVPVKIGEDKVVVLRVVDHQLPKARTLAEVQPQVEAALRQDAARKAAAMAAKAAAQQSTDGGSLAAATGMVTTSKSALTRAGEDGVPPELVKAAFVAGRPGADGKPVAGTVGLANGDTLAFIVKSAQAGSLPAGGEELLIARRQNALQGAQRNAAAEFGAYTNELRRTSKIERNPATFE